jgi:hypothetical protein
MVLGDRERVGSGDAEAQRARAPDERHARVQPSALPVPSNDVPSSCPAPARDLASMEPSRFLPPSKLEHPPWDAAPLGRRTSADRGTRTV